MPTTPLPVAAPPLQAQPKQQREEEGGVQACLLVSHLASVNIAEDIACELGPAVHARV